MERTITAAATISVPAERVRDLLAADPCTALGGCAAPTMSLRVRVGATEVDQEVRPRLGMLDVEGDTTELPLSWEAVSHRALLPRFDGVLRTTPSGCGDTTVALCGRYTVPLGPVGRFGDGVLGHRLARRSLDALVEEIAGRLVLALDDQCWRPPPYPIALQE